MFLIKKIRREERKRRSLRKAKNYVCSVHKQILPNEGEKKLKTTDTWMSYFKSQESLIWFGGVDGMQIKKDVVLAREINELPAP